MQVRGPHYQRRPINDDLNFVVKNVYGRRLVYPDCETSKLLTQLTGNTTISEDQLKILEDIGFKITMKAGL